MRKFFEEFKAFALRGNVMDMAVGIIVGGAFTGIVTSLTENFINPLLNVVTGADNSKWTIADAVSAFGTTVINFFITAFVLFCLIKIMNKVMSVGKKPEAPAEPTTKICPYCLSEIPVDAVKCAHCTSDLNKQEEA